MNNRPIHPCDIVKFKPTASAVASDPKATEYLGLVIGFGTGRTYVQWYTYHNNYSKGQGTSSEVEALRGWVNDNDIELVGSFWHIVSGNTKMITDLLKQTVKKPGKAVSNEAPREKRKYVRKPGAAKPGPKPKKDKATGETTIVVKAPKAPKAEPEKKEKVEGNTAIPLPIGRYGKVMDNSWMTGNRKYCFATGKFEHYLTRGLIEDDIAKYAHLHKRIDYNLDFVIVGSKPGPSKIEKLKYFGIPMISEEQWLAMIGTPGYEFDIVHRVDAIHDPEPLKMAN